MNPYTFTYVIGYRHSMDRISNLRRTLDWVNGFNGVEVLLIEQDEHSKIKNLNLKAKHIFLKSKAAYNRSWAFNVATKYAMSNVIVFGDSDLVMNPDQFIEGLKALQNFEMVSPYKSVVDLTPQENAFDMGNILQINRPGRGETDNQKINIAGGIAMFRKDSIMRIGGWNQSFIGWGGEDDYQAIKIKNFLSWTELEYRCFHLYHEKVKPDMKYYQRNLQILNNAISMSVEDLSKQINNSLKTMGMKNLYDR
jgi:predicted glycosyltransferase involved in capsule biosynthesis